MSVRRSSILPFLLLGFLLVPAPSVEAQRVIADDEWCEDDRSGDSRSERFCEVREFDIDARDLVRVDAEPNGGIRVEGWDRNEIALRAKVSSWSRSGDPGLTPLPLLAVAAGLLDSTANVAYLLATREGLLSLVAVVASLYPAGTVFLARVVLGERLGPQRLVGVVAALGAVALIAI